jgi:oxalate decarboxylase/phosphoglucose isomerase-like protein (cupin superfamily)
MYAIEFEANIHNGIVQIPKAFNKLYTSKRAKIIIMIEVGPEYAGHYHHSKTEKFLVIKGQARFGFRHILTDDTFTLLTSGDLPTVVETIPGWSHDITNIGDDEMIVMLWANEIFDRDRPDTIASRVF